MMNGNVFVVCITNVLSILPYSYFVIGCDDSASLARAVDFDAQDAAGFDICRLLEKLSCNFTKYSAYFVVLDTVGEYAENHTFGVFELDQFC